MGDSKNVSPEVHNMRRREVKQHQSANAHARAAHRHEDDLPEFQPDFEGKFTPETEAHLAELAATGFVTAGGIYQLVQEDAHKVVVELTGPEPALVALNAQNMQVCVRPFAFRTFEKVQRQDGEGNWVPDTRDERMPFKCRSVVVPIGSTGFAIKMKYNGGRQCIVVC